MSTNPRTPWNVGNVKGKSEQTALAAKKNGGNPLPTINHMTLKETKIYVEAGIYAHRYPLSPLLNSHNLDVKMQKRKEKTKDISYNNVFSTSCEHEIIKL